MTLQCWPHPHADHTHHAGEYSRFGIKLSHEGECSCIIELWGSILVIDKEIVSEEEREERQTESFMRHNVNVRGRVGGREGEKGGREDREREREGREEGLSVVRWSGHYLCVETLTAMMGAW